MELETFIVSEAAQVQEGKPWMLSLIWGPLTSNLLFCGCNLKYTWKLENQNWAIDRDRGSWKDRVH